MAEIQLKFDAGGNPITPSMIIAKKSGKRLGKVYGEQEFHMSNKMKTVAEFSFSVHKYLDGKLNPCWHLLKNFRLIYCVEWDHWFELTVSLDESNNTIKNVIATALCETELGQVMLYGVEINTEDDALINDGVGAIIWDDANPYSSTCILWRIIKDKASHFKIAHVDESLKKLNRTFEFDNKSIYDALEEVANEINALVVYGNENVESDISLGSAPARTISFYDLEASCDDCGYRGEDGDEFNIHDFYKPNFRKCPVCGSSHIRMPYGDDTTILITTANFSEDIQFQTDTDAVKNVFHLVAGDDLLTAAVTSCMPNGSQYLYYFSDELREEMSEGLQNVITSYEDKYNYYEKDKIYFNPELEDSEYPIKKELVDEYNNLIPKYKEIYNNYFLKEEYKLEEIPDVTGYQNLSVLYYNTMDFESFLNYSMSPMYNYVNETNLDEQAEIVNNLTNCSVGSIRLSTATSVKNTVQTLLKMYMDKAYKVDMEAVTADTFKDNGDGTGTFTSTFTIYAYANSDTVKNSKDTELVVNLVRIIPNKTITVDENYSEFMTQKMKKIIADADKQNVGMMNLFDFDTEVADFEERVKWYSLTILGEIQNVGQSLLDLFATVSPEQKENAEGLLEIEKKISDKMKIVESELQVREADVFKMQEFLNNISYVIDEVQTDLDFQSYVINQPNGENLWKEFCSFRREDEYKNDNYISNGFETDNRWLVSKANEYIERAKKELYKSAMYQHSITTSLYNILTIKEFAPLRKYFKLGNWMRVKIDDHIYKLRLLEYDIDFSNIDNSDVVFSDVKFVSTGLSDVESILSQAQSMATSYDSMKYQMTKNMKATEQVNDWVQNGFANTKLIYEANGQNIIQDERGLLIREFDPVTETYSPTQMRIFNSSIYVTTDNWETYTTAIGKFTYLDPFDSTPDNPVYKESYGINSEAVVGKFLLGEKMGLYNEGGTLKFDQDGLSVRSGETSVEIVPESNDVFKITTSKGVVFLMQKDGNLTITGNINANSIATGEKNSSEGANGLYIDKDGNLSAGTTNQIQINANGTFSLGGSKGITFDGTKIILGSNVYSSSTEIQSLQKELETLKTQIAELNK